MDPVTRAGNSQPSAAAAAAANATDTAASTEDRFLKLLVAQMRNQDPLNPLDNAQVTSQLAQINTVRGIEELNASMSKMAAAATAVSPASVVGLLGRQVLVAGNSLEWSGMEVASPDPDPTMPPGSSPDAKSARLGFELASDARAVRVEIVDASGRAVHAYEAGDVPAGVHSFAWDGRDSDGRAVAAGKYTVRAYAAGYDKAELNVDALVPARVNGVTQASDGARIELDGQPARAASKIRAIL